MSRFEVALPEPGAPVAWRNREWLVTNGLGGYATGTLAGVCTRRYHGLFVPNLQQPRGRHVMVSRLDEEITCEGQVIRLGGGDLAGRPLTEGNAPWLRAFRMDGNIACWSFACGEVTLQRELAMPHQRNTVCVRYAIAGAAEARIRLRPWLPFRRQDAPLRMPGYGRFRTDSAGPATCHVELPDSNLRMLMQLVAPGAAFAADPAEEPDGWLWREDVRGYDSHEALASPGFFEWHASPGSVALLVFDTDEDPATTHEPAAAFEAERQRTATLVERAAAGNDPVLARLAVAADQFLILPESRSGEDDGEATGGKHPLRTVVAGYYWFLDWGRDTMISLEGLMLATGRHAEARATLLTFSHYVRDGLLPNLFPEGSAEGRYHTVDATLWYFHAIHRYVLASGDTSLVDELLPVLRSIMEHHLAGTRFHICVDEKDGLLEAASPHHALTWMDAHMGEWIVTPRRGKPVEIQALWYNALRLMQRWETAAGMRADYGRRADRAYAAFNGRFWNAARNCLFDVVDGEQGSDARLRPNQLFAISLDHPVLDPERWPAVLEAVTAELLTPVGLRTLEQGHADYCRNYHGNLEARDAAYHQGTVWPWLLGAYIDAWRKVHGASTAARHLLGAFPAHLHESGLGTISEVFDGAAPHVPHGCVAQAWSVAEVLRCWKLTC